MDKNARTQARGGFEVVGAEGAEVIPETLLYDGLPADIKDRCQNAIDDFLLYECRPPVEDLRKEKQLLFNACCDYVGRKLIKPITYPRERGEGGRWQKVNAQAVERCIDLFLFLCNTYNKVPTIYCFSRFCGISLEWFYDENYEKLTPERTRILQKVRKFEYVGIKEAIIDGSRNPTGGIAILNNEYWQTTQAPQDARPALSAVSLPVLGSPAAQNVPILETMQQDATQESP